MNCATCEFLINEEYTYDEIIPAYSCGLLDKIIDNPSRTYCPEYANNTIDNEEVVKEAMK